MPKNSKHQIKQARLFFKDFRTSILNIPADSYVQRRHIIPLLLNISAKYDLSENLRKFIHLGLAEHGLNPEAATYRKTEAYLAAKDKWNKCFHIKKCGYCGTKISCNTRTHVFKENNATFCSKICQNSSPVIREKNRQGLLRLMADPKRRAAFMRKTETTSWRKHGTRHQNQTKEARERISIAARNTGYSKFRLKEFEYKGHRWSGLQGYEPQALSYLLNIKNKKPNQLRAGNDCIPSFKYLYNGIQRTYYPDILLNENMIIEVKSEYTMKLDPNKIKAKLRSVRSKGFNVALMIMGHSGNLIKAKIWMKS